MDYEERFAVIGKRINELQEEINELKSAKKPPKSYDPQELIKSKRKDYRIIGYHMVLYKEEMKIPYVPTWGADCTLISKKLRFMPENTFLRLQQLYFDIRKENPDWIFAKPEPTIPNFCKRINEVASYYGRKQT